MTDISSGGPVVEASLDELRAQLEYSRKSLREMSKVGMALMGERDPLVLFDLILTQARSLTSSDAGSLYLVESDEDGSPLLHFIASQNDTLPHLPSPTFRLPLDQTSLAGYAATEGRPLVLDDVYELPADVPYSFNKEAFDEKHRYRAKGMLIVPMIDHRERVVGVLQLINRKASEDAVIRGEADAVTHVVPFGESEVETVRSLAGQAAVSIENSKLYHSVVAKNVESQADVDTLYELGVEAAQGFFLGEPKPISAFTG